MKPRWLALVLLALLWAWWPGQSHANALRLWLCCGALPLLWWTPPASLSALRWGAPLLGVAALGLAWSPWLPAPGSALLYSLQWLGSCAALWLGWRASESRASLEALPWIAALGGSLLAPTLLLQPGGSLGNPNWMAHTLVWTLIWTGAGSRRGPAWRRGLLGLGAVVQAVALWSCHSLGALAALLVVGVACFLARRRRRWVWAPALFLIVLGALCLPPVVEHLEGRAWLLSQGWSAWWEAPWGVGPGQVAPALLRQQAQVLAQAPAGLPLWTYASHVHQEGMQALLELGPLGLLALVPLLGALWRRGLGAARLAVLATCVLGLVSLPLYEPATGALAFFSAGIALGSAPDVSRREWAWPPVALWGWRAVLVAALLLSLSHLLADRLLLRGVEQERPEVLRVAAALSLHPERALRHRAALLLEEGDAAGALGLAQEAVARSEDPTGHVLVGRALMALGRLEEARDSFARAVWLHPGLFAGHFNLARAYEDLGQRHEARRHAQRARALRPGDERLRWLPR